MTALASYFGLQLFGCYAATMIDPNGIARIQLTVRDVARSRPFYRMLLHETFGMRIQYDGAHAFYCIGGRIEANHVPGRSNLDVIKDKPLPRP